MNEKDRIQRQYLQEKMYEERAARLAELEYQRKINADKASNAAIKLQWVSHVYSKQLVVITKSNWHVDHIIHILQ